MRLPTKKFPKSYLLIGIGILWGTSIGVGLVFLLNFTNEPGLSGNPPATWPQASNVTLASDYPTLVMAVHPRCACTKASLNELAVVLAKVEKKVQPRILVSQVKDLASIEQLKSDVATNLSLPLTLDPDGVETKRFGFKTSGHVVLYSKRGELIFSGGITPGRGHAGTSLGEEALIERIKNGATDAYQSPIFGCNIFFHKGGDEKKQSI